MNKYNVSNRVTDGKESSEFNRIRKLEQSIVDIQRKHDQDIKLLTNRVISLENKG